jgi:hypothetical protein
MRLLLIEFFPGALRRNEKSMLFPFLQGLARELGCATRWLCFGGALAPASEGYGGRMLRADLDADDRAVFAAEVAAFAPTHVVTSDLLSARLAALLQGAGSPAGPVDHLVMPTVSDLVFGATAAMGLARAGALFSADPRRHDYLARCGGYLAWWGVAAPAWTRRHLVAEVIPDYDAVLANEAARTARAPLTIVSGGICGNRRPLAANPCFAGVDLGELRHHRGCAFCMSATMPPYSPAGADPLALWERQLRRVGETAGPGGRSQGVFELFDHRAFRRVDEVAALVTRLELPPSVFLFNPRIDEVLRARRRLERALPALAAAGHELRILSMGVESFSPAENARLNKGISLAQVDAFLALARRFERDYPGAFLPFKAGQEQIELGFILFTPWTTLEDLRCNLDRAAERRFCPTGYWLYSTLDIQEMEPMFRLARQAGDLLVARFPDRGQYYGVYLNETEVAHLVPWKFRDPRVADFFALLVRVCATEREGAGCAFFRDDPEFPAVAAAYGAARRRAPITPLAVARALLDVVEAAPSSAARAALLDEALARVAPPTAAVDPDAVPAPGLSARAAAVARVLARLEGAAGPVAGLAFRPVEEHGPPEARRVRLAFSVAGRDLVVDLLDAASDGPSFLRARHFRAVYHAATPITSARHRDQVTRLLRLLDDGLDEMAGAAGVGAGAGPPRALP